jgi:hypothetical protein
LVHDFLKAKSRPNIFSLVVSPSEATYRAAWRPSLAMRFWATGKSFKAEILQRDTLTKNLDQFLKFSWLANPLNFYGKFSGISLEARFSTILFSQPTYDISYIQENIAEQILLIKLSIHWIFEYFFFDICTCTCRC